MHWIYILKCDDDQYYVGETTKLFTRLKNHFNGNGGVNTSTYEPDCLVAVYKLNKIGRFLDYNENVINNILYQNEYDYELLENFNDYEDDEYDNLYVENQIAECLMVNHPKYWHNIRGGKYTRLDINYSFPNNDHIKQLPICKCGLPCDVNKNEDKNYLYFRCAKKNMWDSLIDHYDIDCEPCNFFKEYVLDKKLRIEGFAKYNQDDNEDDEDDEDDDDDDADDADDDGGEETKDNFWKKILNMINNYRFDSDEDNI